jgi:hypothetical protein
MMDAVDGMVEGTKDGLSPAGLNWDKAVKDIGEMLHQKGLQGLAELGAAFFMGQSNAYVPYGQGQWMSGDKGGVEQPDHGLGNKGLEAKQDEPKMDKGMGGM